MTEKKRFDFVVIGAGMAGCSAAYELAERGRVLVIERESEPGYHATGRSAALFAEAYGNRTIRGLTTGGGAFLRAPPRGFAEHPLLQPRGALYVAGAEIARSLPARLAEGRQLVPDLQLLDLSQARQIVPVLETDFCAGAIYEPGAQAVDVAALHQGYVRGLRARGGELRTAAALTRAARIGDDWELEYAGGVVRCGVLVNAGGAWGDEVADACGVPRIGLQPRRRTAFLFAPEDRSFGDWPLTINLEETLYFKPESGQLMVSPADETDSEPCDAQADEMDIAVAIDRLERWTSLRVRRIAHRWAGLRTFAADKVPIAGFDPLAPGFFWLVGQGGSGIKTAPGLARAVAALARGHELPQDLADLGVSERALSPARFRKP